MTKWADYGISDVSFNNPHTHIDSVKVRLDNGDTIGSAKEYCRSDIVAAIKRGRDVRDDISARRWEVEQGPTCLYR